MTPRSIELSHQWHTWHRAQWQHHLREMVQRRAEGRFELAALEAEHAEWSVLASRAHARLVGKRGAA